MSFSVIVNVYDMTESNRYAYPLGLGIFHSGVEVLGKEYCFGGHHLDCSGVFTVRPKIGPPNVIFRESITVGYSDLSETRIMEIIREISQEYRGRSYHLLNRNCNHFTADLCKRLVGRATPNWINRTASLAKWIPSCLMPDEYLAPPTAEGEVTAMSPDTNFQTNHVVRSPFSVDEVPSSLNTSRNELLPAKRSG